MAKVNLKTKALSMAMAASMIVSLCPSTVYAVSGSQVAADGTYTKTAHVSRVEDEDSDDDWSEYDVEVSLTVKDGKFSNITVTGKNGYDSRNDSYFNKAYNKSKGIKTKLEGQTATEDTINSWDSVSGATRTSKAVKEAALAAIQSASEAKASVDTSALESAIEKAEALKEADYTKATWKTLEAALEDAKSASSAKESQDKVDTAAKTLGDAIDGLKKADVVYVLMNIPYDEFYKADLNNDVKVDAFTSATKTKTRTGSLAGGSYHEDSTGAEITGVTFPVQISENVDLSKYTEITDSDSVTITVTNRGKESTTTYSGQEALFESPTYSYYKLSEVPSYYKEATVDEDGNWTFGKVQGTATELSGVTAELTTETGYGDYQLDLSRVTDTISTSDKIYGVIISTKEGNDYGLRHLENIWRVSELAWCTGYTASVHNCPTSSAHYAAMMGQTITKVTYYTSKGIYTIPMEVYVPVKSGETLTVADASADNGVATVTAENFPSDYQAVYSVEGLQDVKVEDGKLTFTGGRGGAYTLTVTDASGKYAAVSADFTLTTDKTPVAWDNDAVALVAGEGFDSDDLAAYTKNISTVTVNGKEYAATGKRATTMIKADGTLDTGAEPFVDAKDGDTFEITVKATGYNNNYTFTYTVESDYKYVYAGLSWSEYWAAENVYAAGSTESSDLKDKKREYDRGAFDTVTRATTNHGLHRGSYQCSSIIYMKDGTELQVAYYTSATAGVLTNGETFSYDKSDIDHYVVTGLKYVPVKVAKADYKAFCEKYDVVENGGTLSGGYSENKLSSYTGLVADVSEDTNGLKTAVKNEDGSFSFSARKTDGTASGIKDQEIKTAPDAETAGLEVKPANGSYGEFLRVDLTGDYGDLAANMQAVTWTYYGNDSTYSTPVATYGTKFAADNWMHKSMGIQLGLTDSARCQLPEGTDGTGYWTITIAALGYNDVTYQFQATSENIVAAEDPVKDLSALKDAIAAAEELNQELYTEKSWSSLETELQEAKDELEAQNSQSAVNEAVEHLNNAIASLQSQYVLMNIPYAEFYAADVNNDVAVDAFTSATKNKVKTGSLAGGSYHVDASGDKITGVTFPVKLTGDVDLSGYTQITDESTVDITVTNRGKTSTTTYTGKDALFESATYSYYNLSEIPSYYKEVSVNEDGTLSFGKTVGEPTALTGITAKLSTESNYGDYQLNLEGLTDQLSAISDSYQVYGVIVSTSEGSDYGMRHLENIWRVYELAWCTGFTSEVHGCQTSSAHYAAMMGQHINKVTYYTSLGIYTMDLDDIYVPVKFEYTAAVADAPANAGETTVEITGLPEDYVAEYTVEGLDGAAVAGGKLTWDAGASVGKYTLTISDKGGKYADITTSFVLTTDEMPAAYDSENKKLVAADGFTADDLAAYLGAISSVNVNGTDYSATGRGKTVIINEDGTIKTDAEPIAAAGTYTITVTATGYTTPLTFTYVVEEPAVVVDTTSLEKAIADAEALKESDYTADSWKTLKETLANAKSALEAKESQETVDAAANTLNDAISKLVKKSSSAAQTTNTTNTTGKTTGTNSGSGSTSNAVKTGDPANILGLLCAAAASLGTAGATVKYRRRRNRK